MNVMREVLFWCVFSSVFYLPTAGFDPGTLAVAGAAGAVLGGLWKTLQYVEDNFEVCDSRWIAYNATGLKNDLEKKLFGQPVASKVIFRAVDDFLRDGRSRKPLVLSLHGLTGTGKNYASKIIADNLYRKGTASKYVRLISAAKDFPDPAQLDSYKSRLFYLLLNCVVDCRRCLFILDEVDKMDPALMDVIRTLPNHWLAGLTMEYRESVFLFLSNAGGESVADKALASWREGGDRDELELEDLQTPLFVPGFSHGHGDFSGVGLTEGYQVDVFVPFLPLEYDHVVQCAMAAMEKLQLQPKRDVAETLARDLVFFPKSEPIFSSTGCKTIEKRLPFYL